MLRADELIISLDCDPIELANPEVRSSMKDVSDQLENAGVSSAHLLHFRTGTVMASMSLLGPYVVPVASVVIPTLAAILIAWIKASPTRKVRLKIGDVLIEATSVEDVERLIPRIRELQEKQAKKPGA
jgi:hypothetical protein